MATVTEYGPGIKVQEMAFKFGNFMAGELVKVGHRKGRVVAVSLTETKTPTDKRYVPVLMDDNWSTVPEWYSPESLSKS